jgi:hypothetical protein
MSRWHIRVSIDATFDSKDADFSCFSHFMRYPDPPFLSKSHSEIFILFAC